MIAGAAVLRLGAVVTNPPDQMTVGESWLRAFADTLKVGLFVVLPMLIVAAVVEVQITPHVVTWAIETFGL